MDTVGAMQEFLQGTSDIGFEEAARTLATAHVSVLVETLKAFDEWDIAAVMQQLAIYFDMNAVDMDAPYDEAGYDEHDDSKDDKSLPPLDLSDIPF